MYKVSPQPARNTDICAICSNSLNSVLSKHELPCSNHHVFHSLCILPIIEESKVCPIDNEALLGPALKLDQKGLAIHETVPTTESTNGVKMSGTAMLNQKEFEDAGNLSL